MAFVIVNAEGEVTREFRDNAADVVALALEMTCEGDENYSKRVAHAWDLCYGVEPVKCHDRGKGVQVAFPKLRDLWQS